MTKIEAKCWSLKLGEEEIKQGTPTTLKRMVSYLREQHGVKVYAFIECCSSAVIIKYKGITCQFVNSSKACMYLFDIYEAIAKEEINNFMKERLKNKILKEMELI